MKAAAPKCKNAKCLGKGLRTSTQTVRLGAGSLLQLQCRPSAGPSPVRGLRGLEEVQLSTAASGTAHLVPL